MTLAMWPRELNNRKKTPANKENNVIYLTTCAANTILYMFVSRAFAVPAVKLMKMFLDLLVLFLFACVF